MAGIEGEAIVLRVVDYGESDLIAHLLMPEVGRLTVIAKYARKSQRRFPGSLDLFNHLRVWVSRRRPQGLGFLEQAVLVAPFLPLRADSARYALASYLVEWMDRVAPEDGARRGPIRRCASSSSFGPLRRSGCGPACGSAFAAGTSPGQPW